MLMEDIHLIDRTDYGNGEFEFIKCNSERAFLKSAHKAIRKCELWEWLQNKGCIWSSSPELDRINKELWKDTLNKNHSVHSYVMTMQSMECIARNGYEYFKQKWRR